ncbi:MAG: serine/threonine protein kinase [Sandaracinaceae bacterium]|nr:serine/threonine protein kinase [Sandaracinaceae bacterium]
MADKKNPDGPFSEPVSLSGRTVAGRYRVVGVVGQGGIGKVYEAEQIGLDRTVAVKVIRPERRGDEVTIQRFLREARAAGRISSPHVVTLYDCGTDEGTGELYIAMELLHGQSLSKRLADGETMELAEVLRTAAMIARGLRAAHEAGVLHRDLKPANVYLCDDGNVKVLDFGIAKLLDDSDEHEPLTQVNRILGTPVYMSPEAATRRPLGPTTDLYALGLLIYEMVVGAPPFRTGDAWKTLEAHVKTEPPRLTAAAPWRPIPEGLDGLVASLLAKTPQDRPRDAGEVAGQLDRMAMEVALRDSRANDRTEVEVRLPAHRERRRSEPPPSETPDLDTPPIPIPGSARSDTDSHSDDGFEPTTVWAGASSSERPRPPEEVIGRPFPKEELEAYRKAKLETGPQPASRATRRTSQRQIAIAAVVLAAITFVVILLVRLIF